LAATLVLAGLALADDPPPDQPEQPVRLKKKSKPGDEGGKKEQAPGEAKPDQKKQPEPRPPRPGEKGKAEEDAEEPPPEVDEHEVLARVSKNMRASEERLAKKELSEGTKQVQRDILKDLDDLIKLSQRDQQQDQQDQQNQQNQGQAGSKQKQGGQQAKGAAGKQNKMQSGKSQRAERQARRARRRSQQRMARQGGRQQEQQPQQGDPQQGGNQPGAGKGGRQGEMNKIADLYKDIWGHLPETMRAEMDAYARERFMAKYEELIKQYYDRASRESRRKGD
jgi:hypothetical protein